MGPVSPRAYTIGTGVNRRTALRDLQELVARGLLTARGSTKDRQYVLRHEDS